MPKELQSHRVRMLGCYICLQKIPSLCKRGPNILLRSDHQPLQWLRKQKDPRGKFSRWIMELEQYDLKIKYKPGLDIQGPDAMSRIEVGKAGSDNDEAGFFEDHIYEWKDVRSINEWKELLVQEQTQDKSINIAKEQIEKEGKVRLGRYKNYKQLFLQDGLVVKSGRILVPNSLKYQIGRDYHSTDHWGTENTYTSIADKYYWPNMRNYIQTYCF